MMADTIRVLYVDDEPDLLDIGRLFLEQSGDFSVTTVSSAPLALELIGKEPFEAIVSDYQMPGMDGIEFLVEVRTHFGPVPFILFTGRGREEVVIQALNNGADFYMQKGGEPTSQFAELSNKIRYAVKRRQVENALSESEEKYRELVENANSIILKWDKSGNITFFNEFAQQFFGFSSDEIIGKPVIGTIVPVTESGSDRKSSLLIDDIIRHPEDHIFNENENITKDGKRVWIQWHNKPLFDENGDFTGLFSIGADITESKRSELLLLASEEKFRSLVEHALEAILILDFQGKILFANNAAACTIESSGTMELIGRNVMEFIAPESQVDVMGDFHQVSLGHDAYLAQYHVISAKGNKFFIESVGKVISYEGKPAVIISIRDSTESKRAEDALRRMNQKLSVLSQLTWKDLNNQVFVLSSYLELVKNQLAGQDRIIATLEKGFEAVRSINKTIEYTKDYQEMGAKPQIWQNVKTTMLLGLSHLSIGNIHHGIETENLEIFADPLLEKVCLRLFENSVTHGGHVTDIRVWNSVTPNGVIIIFEDNGIGIPPEKKEQIFLRGDIITQASMRSLVFVREILDITGITIRENGEPGKGARFEILVPKGMYRQGERLS